MSALAPASKAPTATMSGSSCADTRGIVRAQARASTSTLTALRRAVATAHGALSCAASPRPTMKSPKPRAATSANPTPAAMGPRLLPEARTPPGFARDQDDPDERQSDSDPLQRGRRPPPQQIDDEGNDRRGRRDRRHDSHRADRHALVETPEPDHTGDARPQGEQQTAARSCRARRDDPAGEPNESDEL